MPSDEDHSVAPQVLIQAGLDKSTKLVVKEVRKIGQEATATLEKVGTDLNTFQRKADVLVQKVMGKAPDDPELSKRKDATDDDDNFYSLYRRIERKFSAELVAFYRDSATKLLNNETCPPLLTSDAPYRIHVCGGVVCPFSIGFLIMLGSIPETELTFPRLEKVYTIALSAAAEYRAKKSVLTRENTNLSQMRQRRNGEWTYTWFTNKIRKEGLSENVRKLCRVCRDFVLAFISKQQQDQHTKNSTKAAKEMAEVLKKLVPQVKKDLHAVVGQVSEMEHLGCVHMMTSHISSKSGRKRAVKFLTEMMDEDEHLEHNSKKPRSPTTNPP